MSLIVNLFAGPGAGKSTTAAALFAKLKMDGYDAELVTEYAKELTWERRFTTLENQVYVFGKQLQRVSRVYGQEDRTIRDNHIHLSVHYAPPGYPESFKNFVLDIFRTLDTYNVYLHREKKYNPNGRNQSESEAKVVDAEVRRMLIDFGISVVNIPGSETGIQTLHKLVVEELTKRGKRPVGE